MRFFISSFLLLSFGYSYCQHAVTFSHENPEINSEFEIKGKVVGKEKNGVKIGKFKYYNQLDELVRIEKYNKKGILLEVDRVKPKAYLYNANRQLLEFHRYNVNGNLDPAPGEVYSPYDSPECIERYTYDKNGNLIEVRYFDQNNELIDDEYTPAIIQYVYNDKGEKVKMVQLNRNEEIMEDVMGLAYTTYTYDENGNLIKSQHHKKDGSFSDAQYGTSTVIKKYDDQNNLIERKLLRPDGSLAGLDMAGAPIERFRYNSKGHKIYSEGLVNEQNPLGSFRFHYDDNNNLIRSEYYDVEDTTNFKGFTINEYDSAGNLIIEKSYNENSKLIEEKTAGIEIDIAGWKWPDPVSIHFDKTSFGKISFRFEVNENGEIVGYAVTGRAGGKDFMDFCIDVMNNLKLTRSGGDYDNNGIITFIKL